MKKLCEWCNVNPVDDQDHSRCAECTAKAEDTDIKVYHLPGNP